AGYDGGMVEGRDQREPTIITQLMPELLTFGGSWVVLDDLRTIFRRRRALRFRRVCGHNYGHGDLEQPSGQRHRLSMITGRIGDHTVAAKIGRKRRQGIVCTSKLERAGPLEVFALQQDRSARG